MVKNTVNVDRFFVNPHNIMKTTLFLKDGLRGHIKLAANKHGMKQNEFINYALAVYLVAIMGFEKTEIQQYVTKSISEATRKPSRV